MRKAKGGIISRVGVILISIAMLAEILNLARPLPSLAPQEQPSFTIPAKAIGLPWPSSGQSAIGAQGYGLLATSGTQKPAPIASVAKVITALAVLKQKPLKPNESGPTITLTRDDVDIYNRTVSQDGSSVGVNAGEQITERQALEAMLLPSANNMATSLSIWAFGSEASYIKYANNFVKTIGLSQTNVADASGFSSSTVSTAKDLVNLAIATMGNAALAGIVAESSATVPVVGQVQNTNFLLGQDGVIGIKTGNTEQAGGCFIFAAKHNVLGQNLTIVGSVMNAATLAQSLAEARGLLQSVDSNFIKISSPESMTSVGLYKIPWGDTASAVAKKTLSMNAWASQPMQVTTKLNNIKAGTKDGAQVGIITAKSGGHSQTIPAILKSTVSGPSLWWRLTHP